MLGTKILGMALFLIVIGLGLMGAYFTQTLVNPIYMGAGSAMLALGLGLMIMSILALTGSEVFRKGGLHEGNANAFSLALLRCMLAISIADDVLDEDEVREIAKVYKHLTETEIDPQVIRDTAEEMKVTNTNIAAELEVIVDTIDKHHKDRIIMASLFILAADGDMDERELMMLDDIRLGLKLSINRVEKVKENFFAKRDLKHV